jgi:2',3'-cyclic-nucleotide 2'-phosphodiesterase
LRILMIGDVVGRPGRQAVARLLPGLREKHGINLVIANGENSAGGLGVTPASAEELYRAGVDVLTSGNHIWAQREIVEYLDSSAPILRPLNYPPMVPGRGLLEASGVTVINALGRTFLANVDCPFRCIDLALDTIGRKSSIIIVDFHGEATSEKVVMGWYLDGRVSAVLGTHTHVPTADARILPKGTAHVTDVGMVGPRDSVLGVKPERIITHFTTQLPARFDVADGPVVFNSVLLDVDPASGRATSIVRLDELVSA